MFLFQSYFSGAEVFLFLCESVEIFLQVSIIVSLRENDFLIMLDFLDDGFGPGWWADRSIKGKIILLGFLIIEIQIVSVSR